MNVFHSASGGFSPAPLYTEATDGLRFPFYSQGRQGSQREFVSGKFSGSMFGDDDFSRSCTRHQPRCSIYGVTDHRIVDSPRRTDISCSYKSGVDADSNSNFRPLALLAIAIQLGHKPLDSLRGEHGILCVIAFTYWRTENGHDAVAKELI